MGRPLGSRDVQPRRRKSEAEIAQSIPVEVLEQESERYFKDQEDLIRAVEQLGETGTGGQVNVYRQGAAGHRDIEFLDEYTPAEFSIKAVQRDYGAGIFRAHVQNAGGEMVANKAFKVGKPRRGELPASQAMPAATGPTLDPAALIATVKDTMLAGFKEIAAAMHAPKQGMGVEETIKLLGALQGLNPPARSNGDDGAIEKFSKFVEVIEDIRGPVGADGEVSMLKLVARALDKIAEPLGDVLASVAQKRLAKSPAAAAALGEVIASAAGAETAAAEGSAPMDFSAQLRMFLPMIIAQAAADNDPGTYADMLYDNVPLPEIRKWIAREDWFEELVRLDPRVTPFKKWFTELHDLIVEGLTPEAIEGTKAGTNTEGPGNAAPGGAKPSPES